MIAQNEKQRVICILFDEIKLFSEFQSKIRYN